jgi:hypothetical protein
MSHTLSIDELRYPVGKFKWPQSYTKLELEHWINEIETLPHHLHKAIRALDDEKLDTPYRPDGWTVRQVVHHVADSHTNAFMRFKLALTEDNPTIKPYNQTLWAELPDSKNVDVSVSMHLLENLHKRFDFLMRSMTSEQWDRTFFHPEHNRNIPLWQIAALYDWHGKHHVAHITTLRHSKGW